MKLVSRKQIRNLLRQSSLTVVAHATHQGDVYGALSDKTQQASLESRSPSYRKIPPTLQLESGIRKRVSP